MFACCCLLGGANAVRRTRRVQAMSIPTAVRASVAPVARAIVAGASCADPSSPLRSPRFTPSACARPCAHTHYVPFAGTAHVTGFVPQRHALEFLVARGARLVSRPRHSSPPPLPFPWQVRGEQAHRRALEEQDGSAQHDFPAVSVPRRMLHAKPPLERARQIAHRVAHVARV